LSNFFQLNLKHEKPIFSSHFLKKTPEYSGVFFSIFVTNIGFCQNQNHRKKFRAGGPRLRQNYYLSLNTVKSKKPIFISHILEIISGAEPMKCVKDRYMCKRPLQDSGASGDKRQRLSSDASEIGETKSSETSPESSADETKEDRAAARERQRCAKIAESNTKPCIAVLYTKINGEKIKGKYIRNQYVQFGEPITFTSRVKASKCFGGMKITKIQRNIDNRGRSKIKGGEYEGLYVMFSNKPVEPIMFEGIEIKPAPAKSERVKGHLYVHNDIVRIWDGTYWNCVEHNKRLCYCVECGGASICKCGIVRNSCQICRVQPLHPCTECPHTCVSAFKLECHMRTHTGEKPYECHLCDYKCTQNSHLTKHKGRIHDIGNEECTICWDDCYRPRSWIDEATKDEVKCCRTCYKNHTGKDIRVEQEWSDYLDEHFDKEFRLCSDTRVNSCNKSRPDGLWASNDLVLHWELDEHQHSGKSYSCEEKRISELYDQFSGKQYVVVRVNPHGYTHPIGKAKPDWEERKKLMLNVMKACLTKKWDTKIHVVYLCYSETNPNITQRLSKTMLYDAEDVENFCK